ncbi:hypothetical protein [Fibrobacter sp.]|uniref:hypothetical protein n=1 Tax=Fibrobacter sp. TaxID=35828 RepID=UPI00388DDFDE
MRIKDIKPGGWIRYNDASGTPEIGKVTAFEYDKKCTNNYCLYLEGQDYGRLFERKDFKYSDDVADLIKKDERVIKIAGHYMLGKSFSKEEFIKEVKNE